MKFKLNQKIAATALMGSALLISAAPSVAADGSGYQLSSHILDISTGKPAPDVNVRLMQQQKNGGWKLLDSKKPAMMVALLIFYPMQAAQVMMARTS